MAGIHLAVAVPLIVWQEAAVWNTLSDAPARPPAEAVESMTGRDGTALAASFNPCAGAVRPALSAQQRIVWLADLPAAMLSGWRQPCPAPWTLAGMIENLPGGKTRRTEATIAVCLGTMIVLQWFLLGSFPLSGRLQWWGEPGMLITLCAAAAVVLLPIPGLAWMSELPFELALLAWLVWFFALVWRALRGGWRLAQRRLAPSR